MLGRSPNGEERLCSCRLCVLVSISLGMLHVKSFSPSCHKGIFYHVCLVVSALMFKTLKQHFQEIKLRLFNSEKQSG